MSQFEYTVIPAPVRGEKTRDAKTPGGRYALTLTSELNRMAREGWEYVRADVLPSEERSGLTGRSTVYHNLLVFRRVLAAPGTGWDTLPAQSAASAGTATATAPMPAAEAQPTGQSTGDPLVSPTRDAAPTVAKAAP